MLTEKNKPLFDCNSCLFKLTVCKFITPNEFEILYENSQQLRFKKNEYIMKQDAKSDYIVYLSKGRVKMNFETDSGKNIILTIANAPI